MKTPDQIRNMEFQKSTMGGYKQSDVDLFLEEVASQIEILTKQKNDAERRLQEAGQKSPDAALSVAGIQNVLVSAQRVADQINAEAKEKAVSIEAEAKLKLTEAELKSKDIIAEAERKAILLGETAEEEAAKIIADAEEKAKASIVSANESVELEQKLYDRLKIEIADFKAKALSQCAAIRECVDELPSEIPFNLERSKNVLSVNFDDPEELLKKAVEEKLAKEAPAEEEKAEEEPEIAEPVTEEAEKEAVNEEAAAEEPAVEAVPEVEAAQEPAVEEAPAVSIKETEEAADTEPTVTVTPAEKSADTEENFGDAFQFSFDEIAEEPAKKPSVGFFVENDEELKPAAKSKMHITFDEDDDDDDDDDEPRLFFRKKKK